MSTAQEGRSVGRIVPKEVLKTVQEEADIHGEEAKNHFIDQTDIKGNFHGYLGYTDTVHAYAGDDASSKFDSDSECDSQIASE